MTSPNLLTIETNTNVISSVLFVDFKRHMSTVHERQFLILSKQQMYTCMRLKEGILLFCDFLLFGNNLIMVNFCTGEMTKSEAYQLNRFYSSEQTTGGAGFYRSRKKMRV